MKTKVFEPGAICAAVALLVVLSLPAYAKSGGSSGAHSRVGTASSNATSVKSTTSSRTVKKPEKKVLPAGGSEASAGAPKAAPAGTVPRAGIIAAPTVNASAATIVVKNSTTSKKNDAAAARKEMNGAPVRCVGKNC
jgi:hypothetical protein